MRFLLDTNVWIEILKGRNRLLLGRFSKTTRSDMATCAVVRGELMYGAEKYTDGPRRRMDVATLLGKVVSLPFDDACADRYGLIRRELELARRIIGPYDLQIAAIALEHDLTVVTGNVDEFSRVHGLRVEDWSI
jgi:tRNA(fMet)-specific endonuclease VapC